MKGDKGSDALSKFEDITRPCSSYQSWPKCTTKVFVTHWKHIVDYNKLGLLDKINLIRHYLGGFAFCLMVTVCKRSMILPLQVHSSREMA